MNLKEIVARSESLKALGNSYFSQNNFSEAIKYYSQAISTLDGAEDLSESGQKFLSVYFANRSLCYLSTNDFDACLSDCTSSISYNPFYSKAYFRRAKCFRERGQFESAMNDLKTCLDLGEASKSVLQEMGEIRALLQNKVSEDFSSKKIIAQVLCFRYLYIHPFRS